MLAGRRSLADLPESRALEACERLKAPARFTLLATKVSAWRAAVKTGLRDAEACMTLLMGLDALRRNEPFEGFANAAGDGAACARSRAVNCITPGGAAAAQAVKATDVAHEGLTGPDLGAAIRSAQIERIRAALG
ncbi:MAG: hypothetical protein CM15mP74_16890 [Halieaceae bacterium]|nr:MAG: hypothetical protein CM15mP74_16890 [Halieaceae bacterium]